MECPPTLESYGVENVQLAPEREHQQINAALAVALCISWACLALPLIRIHQLQQVTFPSPIGHVLQRSCVLVNGRWLEHSFSICRFKSCMCYCNSDSYRNLSSQVLEFTGFCKDLKEMSAWQEEHVKIVVPSFRAASLGVPGLVETASYDMLDAENDFDDYDLSILEDWMQTNLRSGIAAVSHEERHAAHIELLSELKNSTGSGGQ
ncbi:unnamed protein product [Sphagnum jensenii]|uniref:Uncharacterized protein n=1 Tax=Sphagnum jensenii TaxID=128206 RepID=A0ABP1BP71_9BRYO